MIDLDRFVVTGAASMIGRSMDWGRKLFRSDLDVCATDRYEEILDPLQPSGILHLASLDIRQSQKDPLGAIRTNVEATHALALYAEKRGIPFVFISSGAVFNGPRGTRFSETDRPSPLGVYGQTKCLAETLIQRMSSPWLLIRTGWVFGAHGAYRPSFVDVFMDRAKENAPLYANPAQEGSPTYVKDFLSAIKALILSGETGLFHVVNDGAATAEDMARQIASWFSSSSEILPLPESMKPKPELPRSESEVLISCKIRLRPWQESLEDHLRSRGQA